MCSTLASVLRAESVDPVSVGDDEEVVVQAVSPKTKVDAWSACGGRLNFSFYRNDFLDARTEDYDTRSCEHPDVSATRCITFGDDATLERFDTLVVNSGAHKRSGGWEAYGEGMRVAGANLTASMRRLHGEDAILIVRNTVPGHWGCDER